MGKGDKKSAKGKRVMGSYGVTRKRKKDAAPIVNAKKETAGAAPKEESSKKVAAKKVAEKKEVKAKTDAPKKPAAKKTTKSEA